MEDHAPVFFGVKDDLTFALTINPLQYQIYPTGSTHIFLNNGLNHLFNHHASHQALDAKTQELAYSYIPRLSNLRAVQKHHIEDQIFMQI